MFYIIRVVIVLVFLSIYLSVKHFLKRKTTNGNTRSKKSVIIERIIVILIAVCIFIPFEAPFIRFDSAQSSVAYLSFKMGYETKAVEANKTVFTVSHRNNNWIYHSVIKYDDKYGFCDRHSQTVLGLKHIIVNEEDFTGSINVSKMVNYETDEKCYIISFMNLLDFKKESAQDGWDVQDGFINYEQSTPMKKMVFSDNRTVYVSILNRIDEKMILVFKGESYELD